MRDEGSPQQRLWSKIEARWHLAKSLLFALIIPTYYGDEVGGRFSHVIACEWLRETASTFLMFDMRFVKIKENNRHDDHEDEKILYFLVPFVS